MISRPDNPGKRINRILGYALILSLLLHPLLILLFSQIWNLKLIQPKAQPTPIAQKDEVVTISSSTHHAKKDVAVAGRIHPRPQRPHSNPQPKIAYVPPKPQAIPQRQVVPVPTAVPTPVPTPRRVELSKIVPKAPPQPKPTQIESPQPTQQPERKVAYAKPQPQTQSAHQSTYSRPQQYSPEQLAAIQSDLNRSVAADRRSIAYSAASAAPVSSSMKHYAVDLAGLNARLGGGEGVCSTIRYWFEGDEAYMYVSCRTQRADGSVRTEAIPWALHYPKSKTYVDLNGVVQGPPGAPIMLPDLSWRPDPKAFVDPDVLDFLREHGYKV